MQLPQGDGRCAHKGLTAECNELGVCTAWKAKASLRVTYVHKGHSHWEDPSLRYLSTAQRAGLTAAVMLPAYIGLRLRRG